MHRGPGIAGGPWSGRMDAQTVLRPSQQPMKYFVSSTFQTAAHTRTLPNAISFAARTPDICGATPSASMVVIVKE